MMDDYDLRLVEDELAPGARIAVPALGRLPRHLRGSGAERRSRHRAAPTRRGWTRTRPASAPRPAP